MFFKNKKLMLKKAALVLSFSVIFEAFLFPSFGGYLWTDRDANHNTLAYVADVLRENKTGLGSIEELKLAQVILSESISHKMDPLFVLALIKTESTFYNWSKSFNGAMGLMQILPSTGKELAQELKLKWKGEETLLNPFVNVKIGVHYFSTLQERFNDMNASLAAYNAGPNLLASKMKAGEEVAEGFVKKVLTNYKGLKERAEYY